MLKKTMIALFAAIALAAAFAPIANAQRCDHADREFYSAHADFGRC